MLFNAIRNGIGDMQSFLIMMLLSIPPLLLALSVHECAHAYVALRCGDPTARNEGRMTINPIRHIDPIGLAMLFLVGFGWAKPVPVNPRNFSHYRRDDILVSLAGITANLLMFLVGCCFMYGMVAYGLHQVPARMIQEGHILANVGNQVYAYSQAEAFQLAPIMTDYLIGPYMGRMASYVFDMIVMFTETNLVLAVFNLIPVPPLDGYHLLNDTILRRSLFAPQKVAMAGQALLFVLLLTGWLSQGIGWVEGKAITGMGSAFEWLFRTLNVI